MLIGGLGFPALQKQLPTICPALKIGTLLPLMAGLLIIFEPLSSVISNRGFDTIPHVTGYALIKAFLLLDLALVSGLRDVQLRSNLG